MTDYTVAPGHFLCFLCWTIRCHTPRRAQVLVLSDEHPNVVRCFAMEEDREFVYLALERCRRSLSDAMASSEGQAAMKVCYRPAVVMSKGDSMQIHLHLHSWTGDRCPRSAALTAATIPLPCSIRMMQVVDPAPGACLCLLMWQLACRHCTSGALCTAT
jgi:hypothetical protein